MFELLPCEIIRVILMLLYGREYLLIRCVNMYMCDHIDRYMHVYIRNYCRMGADYIVDLDRFFRRIRENLADYVNQRTPILCTHFTHEYLPIRMSVCPRQCAQPTRRIGSLHMAIGTYEILSDIVHIVSGSDTLSVHTIIFAHNNYGGCYQEHSQAMALIARYFPGLYELITVPFVT
jgi:hypothetical protein